MENSSRSPFLERVMEAAGAATPADAAAFFAVDAHELTAWGTLPQEHTARVTEREFCVAWVNTGQGPKKRYAPRGDEADKLRALRRQSPDLCALRLWIAVMNMDCHECPNQCLYSDEWRETMTDAGMRHGPGDCVLERFLLRATGDCLTCENVLCSFSRNPARFEAVDTSRRQ